MVEQAGVVVPLVVGMSVRVGSAVADAAEVVLAPADPDGPPLAALLWPDGLDAVITGQSPAAGTRVARWSSVVVTYDVAGPGERVPRVVGPSPGLRGGARPVGGPG